MLASDPVFCCFDQQVKDIDEQLAMAAGMMGRCPSCFVNFAKIFFHMTCNPNHSDFLEVTGHTKSTIDPNKQMLTELNYTMANYFANSVFNSCAEVKFPQGGAKIMPFFCDGKTLCTAYDFLSYVGRKDPSPFQINFQLVDNQQKKPMNETVISCASAPTGYSNKSCSCLDCAAQCTPQPYPQPDKPWVVWGMDGMWLTMGFVYYLIVILITGGFLITYFKSKRGLFSSFHMK